MPHGLEHHHHHPHHAHKELPPDKQVEIDEHFRRRLARLALEKLTDAEVVALAADTIDPGDDDVLIKLELGRLDR